MDVEEELRQIDFSKSSRVEESLLKYLLTQRQNQNSDELDFDDLDSVSAAGNIYQKREELE